MALFLFTKAIIDGKPIQVFNEGKMSRDFTYIDDIVDGIVKVIDSPATADSHWNAGVPDPASSSVPYRVFNIGKGTPVNLMDFVEEIEKNLGMKAKKDFLPMQDGDVAATWADIKDLETALGYKPKVSVEEGVKNFVEWYKEYYGFAIPVLD
jgi:UDP-glucuronate 4-epimerase